MRNSFIIRLYHHSKIGFTLVALYLILYTFFFIKKMDMVMFPYNSMFSIDFNKEFAAETYQLKVNDHPVKYTGYLWWKKDFMEMSLHRYALLITDRPYIEKYIQYAYADKPYKEFLLKQLKPSLLDHHWLHWYAQFGNVNFENSSVIAVWKYELFFEKEAVRIDSVLVVQQKLQP